MVVQREIENDCPLSQVVKKFKSKKLSGAGKHLNEVLLQKAAYKPSSERTAEPFLITIFTWKI